MNKFRTLPLPPAGPAWFPATMGTGILASLLQLHESRIPGASMAAVAVLIVAWSIFLGLVVASCWNIRVWWDSVREFSTMPFLATVSMGMLSIGAATALVVSAQWPAYADLAWAIDAVMWWCATIIGVATALGFSARLIGVDRGAPTPVWGLAVVSPMVSATTGAGLSGVSSPQWAVTIHMVSTACFYLSFFVGVLIFFRAYQQHFVIAPIPIPASASSWIPLGVVGQSTAAAQALAFRTDGAVAEIYGGQVHVMANLYGWLMFVVGIPLVGLAVVVTLRGFYLRMPFSPGWWALTFPVGTLALGATWLAQGTGYEWLTHLGALVTVGLVGTVSVCCGASVVAVLQHKNA
ncbi:TDT family transporter [Corynebacterium felinum]|uniref:Tellurite resistance protein TehA-like permease n=1 Tax=Corynebacterium felinum TaxID=131318 RepID=A0ABU2BA32_9CORY|nr:TDT family transporter [Corynebacterium felinum]MDF5821035.1 TDT family transporter [Corynebacterium felinum]MDR7355136.1 tellurite resistance protein TehA-like permease [Corynebacterium felinum]WJY94487.1 C4-dicarboxylate transporter/malic acid transport protein [Corynebacterium felinum]